MVTAHCKSHHCDGKWCYLVNFTDHVGFVKVTKLKTIVPIDKDSWLNSMAESNFLLYAFTNKTKLRSYLTFAVRANGTCEQGFTMHIKVTLQQYLDSFNCIFNLKQSPFWRKCIYSSVIFRPC